MEGGLVVFTENECTNCCRFSNFRRWSKRVSAWGFTWSSQEI